MKKMCAGYLMVLSLLFVLLGIGGCRVIRRAYEKQMDVVANLAGTMFGQTDAGAGSAGAAGGSRAAADERGSLSDFLDGLRNVSAERTGEGRSLLAGYGYGDRWLFSLQDSCRSSMRSLYGLLGVFFVLLAGGGILCFGWLQKKRERQLAGLGDLLERCQREDYSFSGEEKKLADLYDPFLADRVVKLGQNLAMKTRQLAEEKEQTKAVVTDLSHQLKTPVSALKSSVALCVETDGEERMRFLSACMRQTEKLEGLVGALIQISRMEQGMIRLNTVQVPVAKILIEAVNAVYYRAHEKGIRFDTEALEGKDFLVSADPSWSAEAVANLLDNAVKYSPENSRIRIRAERLNTYVQIDIEDQGIGVPKEERNLIFKRFYRGSAEAVRKADGWGVGLYLSRKILEEEGGALFMRPGNDKGSIFIVHLPCADMLSSARRDSTE